MGSVRDVPEPDVSTLASTSSYGYFTSYREARVFRRVLIT